MLLEVYRCVQLKRWSVVCGCVLQRGQRGEGWCVSSTLCRYDIRMGLLLVLNWARVRRVSLGRESSEGEILGACWCISITCYCSACFSLFLISLRYLAELPKNIYVLLSTGHILCTCLQCYYSSTQQTASKLQY